MKECDDHEGVGFLKPLLRKYKKKKTQNNTWEGIIRSTMGSGFSHSDDDTHVYSYEGYDRDVRVEDTEIDKYGSVIAARLVLLEEVPALRYTGQITLELHPMKGRHRVVQAHADECPRLRNHLRDVLQNEHSANVLTHPEPIPYRVYGNIVDYRVRDLYIDTIHEVKVVRPKAAASPASEDGDAKHSGGVPKNQEGQGLDMNAYEITMDFSSAQLVNERVLETVVRHMLSDPNMGEFSYSNSKEVLNLHDLCHATEFRLDEHPHAQIRAQKFDTVRLRMGVAEKED